MQEGPKDRQRRQISTPTEAISETTGLFGPTWTKSFTQIGPVAV
jgi:hypothetical protein